MILEYIFNSLGYQKKNKNVKNKDNSSSIREKFEIEKAKNVYKSLKLEKTLHMEALNRIYREEAEGKINSKEKELLIEKYQKELKNIENELNDSEIIIEAYELENLKDEIADLLSSKVKDIENKLDNLHKKLENIQSFSKEVTVKKPINKEKEVTKEKVVKKVVTKQPVAKTKDKEEKEVVKEKEITPEEKVKDIKDEVMEMVQRLDDIDEEL
tara:strand:- start:153 stop:791 length:639 start_codon:yes stop_codon:yes gene_type:complete